MKARIRRPSGRVLPFAGQPGSRGEARVGRVHRDGSITFRGQTYATIKEVPADCLGLRPDLEMHKEWRRIYRVIAPRPPAPRRKPWWLDGS